MLSFRDLYRQNVVPQLQQALGVSNVLAVPRVVKVSLNVGLSKAVQDKQWVEIARRTLERISGQRPVTTLARRSIAAFKIREGMVVGAMVTLRGQRMYDFLEKLVRLTLPRVRDFRGLDARSVDRAGNLSIGFREHLAFPEIRADEVEKVHGVEVTVTSTAGNAARGLALYRALGFPFREPGSGEERRKTRVRRKPTSAPKPKG